MASKAFPDLDTFFDPDLHLTIRGRVYTVPAVDADEAARLRKLIAVEGLPNVEQVHDAFTRLGATQDGAGYWSGGVYSEMVADKLPHPYILHAGRTAMVASGFSVDMAESHWALTQLPRLIKLEKATEFLARVRSKQRETFQQKPAPARDPRLIVEESKRLIEELKDALRDAEMALRDAEANTKQ